MSYTIYKINTEREDRRSSARSDIVETIRETYFTFSKSSLSEDEFKEYNGEKVVSIDLIGTLEEDDDLSDLCISQGEITLTQIH